MLILNHYIWCKFLFNKFNQNTNYTNNYSKFNNLETSYNNKINNITYQKHKSGSLNNL